MTITFRLMKQNVECRGLNFLIASSVQKDFNLHTLIANQHIVSKVKSIFQSIRVCSIDVPPPNQFALNCKDVFLVSKLISVMIWL